MNSIPLIKVYPGTHNKKVIHGIHIAAFSNDFFCLI